MTIKKTEQKTGPRYKIVFDQGMNEDGMHIRKVVRGFKTLKEAEDFQKSIEKEKLIVDRSSHNLYETKSNKKHKTTKTWNALEIQQFLELAKHTENGLLYEVTLATGLRKREVIALSWSDVDLQEKTLTVNKAVTYECDGKFIPTPINHKRTISLPEQLINKLTIHKNRQLQLKGELGEDYQNDYNLIFMNNKGGVISLLLLQKQFKALVRKAGVREINFHDLRHTHSRLLIQNGLDIEFVTVRLGHHNITTLNLYSCFFNQ